MKELALPELIKTLGTPEKQPMDVLMASCKQAAAFIKNEQMIWKKGAEFAKLFADVPVVADEAPPSPAKVTMDNVEKAREILAAEKPVEVAVEHIQGACNIYITGVRPVKGGMINRVSQLKALREASGELNAAPRMTMQKANELLADLELGDRSTLIRSMKLAEEATEIVKELTAVGIVAELRK